MKLSHRFLAEVTRTGVNREKSGMFSLMLECVKSERFENLFADLTDVSNQICRWRATYQTLKTVLWVLASGVVICGIPIIFSWSLEQRTLNNPLNSSVTCSIGVLVILFFEACCFPILEIPKFTVFSNTDKIVENKPALKEFLDLLDIFPLHYRSFDLFNADLEALRSISTEIATKTARTLKRLENEGVKSCHEEQTEVWCRRTLRLLSDARLIGPWKQYFTTEETPK